MLCLLLKISDCGFLIADCLIRNLQCEIRNLIDLTLAPMFRYFRQFPEILDIFP